MESCGVVSGEMGVRPRRDVLQRQGDVFLLESGVDLARREMEEPVRLGEEVCKRRLVKISTRRLGQEKKIETNSQLACR